MRLIALTCPKNISSLSWIKVVGISRDLSTDEVEEKELTKPRLDWIIGFTEDNWNFHKRISVLKVLESVE